MSIEESKFTTRFESQAQGFALGNGNIIYNYFGYKEEVKTEPVDTTDDIVTCPYQSLYSFRPSEADLFFGRDDVIEELVQAVEIRNFIPLLGASGSGKSSVVLAGLIPELVTRTPP